MNYEDMCIMDDMRELMAKYVELRKRYLKRGNHRVSFDEWFEANLKATKEKL